jgi:hypothetical protein
MYVVGSNMSNVNLTVRTGILLNSFFGKDKTDNQLSVTRIPKGTKSKTL